MAHYHPGAHTGRQITAKRPRHQTEIVDGAHPGVGACIAYTRVMSKHRCFPKRDEVLIQRISGA